MAQKYYSVMTTNGINIVNSLLYEDTETLFTDGWNISLGTGNLDPTSDTTELINPILDKNSVDYPDITFGKHEIYGHYAEITIPESIKGNILTECGLFNDEGILIAVSKIYLDLTETILENGIDLTAKQRIYIQAVPAATNIIYTPQGDLINKELLNLELKKYQKLTEKGVSNGYCPLDENAIVPLANLPELNFANKDLSNLSETGELRFSNKADLDLSNLSALGYAKLQFEPYTILSGIINASTGESQLLLGSNNSSVSYTQNISLGTNTSNTTNVANGNYKLTTSGQAAGFSRTNTYVLNSAISNCTGINFTYKDSHSTGHNVTTKVYVIDSNNNEIEVYSKSATWNVAETTVSFSLSNITVTAIKIYTSIGTDVNGYHNSTTTVSDIKIVYTSTLASGLVFNVNSSNPLVVNFQDVQKTFVSVQSLSTSGYSDGTYTVFINPSGTVTLRKFYKQAYNPSVFPCVWRNTSVKPLKQYYYTSSSSYSSFDAVDVGQVTISSGKVTSIEQPVYNSKYCTVANSNNPAVVTATYKSGSSWYRVWSDGWIEQGGLTAESTDKIHTVSFLKPFSNTYYTAMCCICDTTAAAVKSWYDTQIVTKENASMTVGNNNSISRKISWYACGY